MYTLQKEMLSMPSPQSQLLYISKPYSVLKTSLGVLRMNKLTVGCCSYWISDEIFSYIVHKCV